MRRMGIKASTRRAPDRLTGRGAGPARFRTLALVAVAAAVLSTVVVSGAPAYAAPAGITATAVSFPGDGGVTLHGTVLAPAATGRRHPGLVMIEGAGNRGAQVLRPAAEAFARRGIVALIYDKRTVGYSFLHRDYSVLADDALGGLHLLRSRPDVDPARLGLWGLSEGAWVAPLAADQSTDVKFLITVGAVGLTPSVQTAWAYGQFLRHAGVSGSLRHTMQVTATRVAVGAGLFPEANFDPVPTWEHLRQPVLAQWGEYDRQAVPVQSSQIIRQALQRGGNAHYTIRFVPGVQHDLNLTTNGGFDHLSSIRADYGAFEAAWINSIDEDLPRATVGSPPGQDQLSHPVTPLAWYESRWLQLAVFVLLVVGFAGYPLIAAGRRILGHRGAPPVRLPARLLAATGLTTVAGFLLYMFFMLVTAANLIGPVLLGRPVPWLILQILALATVATTIATAAAWPRHHHALDRTGRVRLGLLLTAGLAFLPWALYWGLLIP